MFAELCSVSHFNDFVLFKSATENMSIFRKEGVQTKLQLSSVQHGACFLGAFPSHGLYLYFGIIQDSPWLAWRGWCWESQSGSKQPAWFGKRGVSVVRWVADHRLHSVYGQSWPFTLDDGQQFLLDSCYRAVFELISVIPGIQMCDRHTLAPRCRCCILAAAEINIISISWWGWNNISGGFGRETEETQFVVFCPWAPFLFSFLKTGGENPAC